MEKEAARPNMTEKRPLLSTNSEKRPHARRSRKQDNKRETIRAYQRDSRRVRSGREPRALVGQLCNPGDLVGNYNAL